MIKTKLTCKERDAAEDAPVVLGDLAVGATFREQDGTLRVVNSISPEGFYRVTVLYSPFAVGLNAGLCSVLPLSNEVTPVDIHITWNKAQLGGGK